MTAAGWEACAWIWFAAFLIAGLSYAIAEHDRRLWRDRALSRYDALKELSHRLGSAIGEHQALLILLARNGIHVDEVSTEDLRDAETPADIKSWGENR